jgi:mono/diheme cytochrome c family protein
MSMVKTIFAGIGVVLIGFTAWMIWGGPAERVQTVPIVDTRMHGEAAGAPARPGDEINVPKLSSRAVQGQIAFEENCAACHGKNASGSELGPPLVHKIYEPSHHADFAFQRAARQGVQAHHWRFGDMQPVASVTDKQIEWITKYVRELQRANGIN